jgi:simple sugar transport system permease protein
MTSELLAVFFGGILAAPLPLASMGEYVSERAGALHMGIKGMMLRGAFAAAAANRAAGSPVIGRLAGTAAAMPVALLQAFLTDTLKASQIA